MNRDQKPMTGMNPNPSPIPVEGGGGGSPDMKMPGPYDRNLFLLSGQVWHLLGVLDHADDLNGSPRSVQIRTKRLVGDDHEMSFRGPMEVGMVSLSERIGLDVYPAQDSLAFDHVDDPPEDDRFTHIVPGIFDQSVETDGTVRRLDLGRGKRGIPRTGGQKVRDRTRTGRSFFGQIVSMEHACYLPVSGTDPEIAGALRQSVARWTSLFPDSGICPGSGPS